MGPALFIGLTLYMLITGKPAEREINPRLEMDLLDAQTEQAPLATAAAKITHAVPLAALPRPVAAVPVTAPQSEGPLSVPAALPAIRKAQIDTALTAPAATGWAPALRADTRTPARMQARWLDLPQAAGLPPDHDRQAQAAPATASAAQPARGARQPRALRRAVAAAPRPAKAPLPRAIVTGDAVHLRAQPTARSEILTRLFSGQDARLLGSSGNWARIYLPGATPPLTGWIYRDYIAAAQNSDS